MQSSTAREVFLSSACHAPPIRKNVQKSNLRRERLAIVGAKWPESPPCRASVLFKATTVLERLQSGVYLLISSALTDFK